MPKAKVGGGRVEEIVRVGCEIPGHEDDWIEFDVSRWDLATYMDMYYGSYQGNITQWIETDSVDWHLTGDGGKIVPHPGRGASVEAWRSTYRALGHEGLELVEWLAITPLRAVREAAMPSKKSKAGSSGSGAG